MKGKGSLSLTLHEEHRLMVLQNMVLRRIFGPKKVEMAGSSRKLLKEELHNVYFTPCKLD
jgi:hypothetical protein